MKEMTIAQFKELAQTCIDELNAIGIYPVVTIDNISISNRLKSTFGHCVYRKRWNKDTNRYEFVSVKIEVSYRLTTDEYEMRDTLYHELLHACTECISCNHDGKWKEYAELVNDCYNMNLGRSGNWNKTEAIEAKRKYRCKCSKCGKIIVKQGYRAPKWYKHPQGYTHTCADGTKNPIISEYYGFKSVEPQIQILYAKNFYKGA